MGLVGESPERLDCLLCGSLRAWEGEDFRGKVAIVSNLFESGEDGRHFCMSEADSLAVGVRKVNMTDS